MLDYVFQCFFRNSAHFYFFISNIVVSRSYGTFHEMAFVSVVFICHQFFVPASVSQLPFDLMEMKMAQRYNVPLPRNLMEFEECKDVDDICAAIKWYVLNRPVICQSSNTIEKTCIIQLRHCWSECSGCNEFSICQNQFGHKIRHFTFLYANGILSTLRNALTRRYD